MDITVKGLVKGFGSFTALHGVDLDIHTGELLAILGPSGSGKTTLLRLLAGLEQPDAGSIRFGAKDVAGNLPGDRDVGFVFQHYALFRHMSVFENVAFGLRVRPSKTRPPESEIRKRVNDLLSLVQVDWLADRYPTQLSGGQRQRVALARALAIEPQVLLLDEPFGALDAKVRRELRRWLRDLHRRLGMTTVFVTHDQEEALDLADRVVVMGQGRVEQIGAPQELYDSPANAFVYRFLGETNELRASLQAGRVRVQDTPIAEAARISVAEAAHEADGTLFVRPHLLSLTPDPQGIATVTHVSLVGAMLRVEVETQDGQSLHVEVPRGPSIDLVPTPGERVSLMVRGGLFVAA
ncbi:MAG: sulfate/molybdate ABC transporter ATP-binding protein [Elstera sp.]